MEGCCCNHNHSSLAKNEQRRNQLGSLEDFWFFPSAPENEAGLTVLKDGPGDEGQLGFMLGLAGVQRSSLFARSAAMTRQRKARRVYAEE